jgi:hypothetical protein
MGCYHQKVAEITERPLGVRLVRHSVPSLQADSR